MSDALKRAADFMWANWTESEGAETLDFSNDIVWVDDKPGKFSDLKAKASLFRCGVTK